VRRIESFGGERREGGKRDEGKKERKRMGREVKKMKIKAKDNGIMAALSKTASPIRLPPEPVLQTPSS